MYLKLRLWFVLCLSAWFVLLKLFFLWPKIFVILNAVKTILPNCLPMSVGGGFMRGKVQVFPFLLFYLFFFHILLLLVKDFLFMLDPLVIDVIFIILVQHNFEHIIEVLILFVWFSHCWAWFQIWLPIHNIGVRLFDNPFSNRYYRPCWVGFWLVLKVAESSSRYLYISWNKIHGDSRLKLHDFAFKYDVIFPLFEKLMGRHRVVFPINSCF